VSSASIAAANEDAALVVARQPMHGRRRGATADLAASGPLATPLRTGRCESSTAPALRQHIGWLGPLVQLALKLKCPPLRLIGLGNAAPVFTGDPPPVQSCRVLTGPLALRMAFPPSPVARDGHDYYGSSATPRRQQGTVRLPRTHQRGSGGYRRDASLVHPYAGRHGRRPAVPRRHRRPAPQPARGRAHSNSNRSDETAPQRQLGLLSAEVSARFLH
jgi:hypothetical protein